MKSIDFVSNHIGEFKIRKKTDTKSEVWVVNIPLEDAGDIFDLNECQALYI
jgi:hypothetical protein